MTAACRTGDLVLGRWVSRELKDVTCQRLVPRGKCSKIGASDRMAMMVDAEGDAG